LLNLPRSRIYGAEVELVARPVSSLALSASLGLLSTHIREGMVQGQNVRGNDLPNAPQVTLSYAADWTAIDGPSGIVRLRIDGSVVGSQHFDILNTPSLRQGSYHLLGARAGWRSPGDKFGIAIWGRNLTNAYYFTSRVAVSSFGFNYNHIGAPRTFGVTVDTRF
jgi:iron complex outermembrane receptor protein